MHVKKSSLVIICLLILVVTISALFISFIFNNLGDSQRNSGDNRLTIVVTNGLMADIVYNIAKENVIIRQLNIGDIHGWEPSAKEISETSKASILIYSSRYVETWIDKMRNTVPENVVFIEAAENVNFISVNGIIDPHFWFDIRNMIKVVDNVCKALEKIDPKNANYYIKNAEIYKTELYELHEEYINKLEKFRGRIIVTRHDAYRYLGETYGIMTFSLFGIHEEEIPSARIQRLIELINNENIKVIYSEYGENDLFITNFAAEYGLKVLKLYSMENIQLDDVKRGEGYIFMMKKNLEALVEGLSLE